MRVTYCPSATALEAALRLQSTAAFCCDFRHQYSRTQSFMPHVMTHGDAATYKDRALIMLEACLRYWSLFGCVVVQHTRLQSLNVGGSDLFVAPRFNANRSRPTEHRAGTALVRHCPLDVPPVPLTGGPPRLDKFSRGGGSGELEEVPASRRQLPGSTGAQAYLLGSRACGCTHSTFLSFMRREVSREA